MCVYYSTNISKDFHNSLYLLSLDHVNKIKLHICFIHTGICQYDIGKILTFDIFFNNSFLNIRVNRISMCLKTYYARLI